MAPGHLPSHRQAGPPDGHPVVLIHGWPGSSLQRPPGEAPLRALGVRLVTIDRPGMGSSPFEPGRTLLDWPASVAAVADHLGLGRFSLAGVSAGGPYALACAFAMPHRLSTVALAGAMAPLSFMEEALPWHQKARLLYGLARRAPWVLPPLLALFRAHLRRARSPIPRWAIARLPPSDRRALRDPAFRRMLLADFRRAFRQGTRGPLLDARILAAPWGFDLSAVTLPVQLWHGTRDTVVPPANAVHLAARLPRATLHWVEGAGHYGLVHRGIGPILRGLLGEGG